MDARAGGLLAKFDDSPTVPIEMIDAPDVPITDHVRPESRTVTEIAQHSAQMAASDEAELLVSVVASQLANIPPPSKESAMESLIVRVDPEAIRDQDLLRSIQPMTVETNLPSEAEPKNVASATEENVIEDAADSTASAQPMTAETNSPSDAKSENGSSDREGNAAEDSVASNGSAASNGAGDSPLPQAAATNPAPPYPEDARAAGLQGKVTLRLRIGADGRVESLKLLASSGTSSFDESALTTVKRWRFEPARRFGRPIAMDVKTSISFRIEAE
ncbi:MAG: energy transducer TonB [Planctomycetaceae bacterium]|nr:energy transducer TonB [Planctomycetaceae bacterium]